MVARFVVETQQTERFYFDEYATQEMAVVNSVMRNLIGNYEILTAKEARVIEIRLVEVSSLLTKNLLPKKGAIMHYFKVNLGIKTEFVSKKHFRDSLAATDVNLTESEFNYCIRFLFGVSQNLQSLPYAHLFERLTKVNLELHPAPPVESKPEY